MSGSTGMAKTPYAWLILFVTCLAHCFWNIAIIQPGGLSQFFFDPSAAYVYTPMEFSMVMTVPFLTTGLFGLVFGVWADKQSLAIATDVGAVLGAIGLVARLFCVDGGFLPVFLSSFLMGFGLAGLNANASKIFAPVQGGKSCHSYGLLYRKLHAWCCYCIGFRRILLYASVCVHILCDFGRYRRCFVCRNSS